MILPPKIFQPYSLGIRYMTRAEAIRIIANAEAYLESMRIRKEGLMIDEINFDSISEAMISGDIMKYSPLDTIIERRKI